MLVHETLHALTYSRRWVGKDVHHEIFFDPDPDKAPLAETGYEGEVRLFGGHIDNIFAQEADKPEYQIIRYRYTDRVSSQLRGIMVMWRWPYWVYGNTTMNLTFL